MAGARWQRLLVCHSVRYSHGPGLARSPINVGLLVLYELGMCSLDTMVDIYFVLTLLFAYNSES